MKKLSTLFLLVLLSINGYTQWKPFTMDGLPDVVNFIEAHDDMFYAGTNDGMYMFLGAAWQRIGAEELAGKNIANRQHFFVSGTGDLYAMPDTVYKYSGGTWDPVGPLVGYDTIYDPIYTYDTTYNSYDTVYYDTIHATMPCDTIYHDIAGDTMYCDTITYDSTIVDYDTIINPIELIGGSFIEEFIIGGQPTIFRGRFGGTDHNLLRSTDGGASFVDVGYGDVPEPSGAMDYYEDGIALNWGFRYINAYIAQSANGWIYTMSKDVIQISKDGGDTWQYTRGNFGSRDSDNPRGIYVREFEGEEYMFKATDQSNGSTWRLGRSLITADSVALNWVRTDAGTAKPIREGCIEDYAEKFFIHATQAEIMKSHDNGETFLSFSTGLTESRADAILIHGDSAFAVINNAIFVYDLAAPATMDSARVDEITETSAKLFTQADVPGRFYYVVLPDTAANPDKNQVLSGLDAAGDPVSLKGNYAASYEMEASRTLIGLTSNTDYKVHLVLKNEVLDTSDVTIVSFSTPEVTYNVTFTVEDTSGVSLQGATVTFGTQTKETNAAGSAVFVVEPESAIAYEVSKVGYVDSIGTLDVDTADVSITIPLTIESYDITFNVTDTAGAMLEGASVVLGNDTLLTDADGMAVFSDVVYASGIAFSVSKIGFNDSAGTYDAVADDTITIALVDYEWYTISFFVTDELTGDPLNNATVDFDGREEVTGADGYAEFMYVEPAAIGYQVSRGGYADTANTINVTADDTISLPLTSIESYSITFIVTDGTDPLEGATVGFGGKVETTNAEGVAVFEYVEPDLAIPYQVSKDAYHSLDSAFDVIKDDTVAVVLTEIETYTVTFTVVDAISSDPIENATVVLGTETEMTDASGNAVFVVEPEDGIAFQVSKVSYDDSTGTINVVDQNVDITIPLTLTSGISEVDADQIAIYPNPTTGLLNVATGSDAQTLINVYDALGTLVKTVKGAGIVPVNLSNNPEGIYLIQFEGKSFRVIKQ